MIEHFSLKKDAAVQPFAVYLNDEICLTVTGLGKIAMAAGVAYTQAQFASVEHPVLLNIGVAGHKYHSLGVLYLIDKIIDVDSQRSYYPPLIFKPPCPSGSLQTLSKPRLNYDQSHLCDMEASAFYETATRFSSGELILCLKIISDNQLSPAGNIQPKQVAGLIAAHLSTVETLLERMVAKVELIATPETGLFEQLIQRHHFSFNEKLQLKNQLSRWNLVTDHKPLMFDDTLLQTGKEVLRWLDIEINNTGLYL